MAYLGNSPGVSSQRVATTFTATAGQTAFNPVGGYTLGYADVYLNGVKLIDGTDFTAADGVTITLASGAALNDNLETLCYTPHGLSDGYTKPEADARYQATANGSINVTGTVTASGEITANGGIALGDGDVATFGDSDDLSIQHLGGNTYLTNTTGSLILRSDSFRVLNTANSEQILHGDANGAVTAYYDNAVKLATTATGIDVTGTATMGGLTVDAVSSSFKSTGATAISIIDTDVTNDPFKFNIENGGRDGRISVWQDIIFSNTGAGETVRIDTSGNLLVGTTSTSSAVAGLVMYGGAAKGVTTQTYAGRPSYINRLSTDGDIIEFARDNVTVGNIGVTNGNNLTVGGAVASHAGIQFGTENVTPMVAGVEADGGANLGATNLRWRDLYLSGGVYLGGTGAPNKLDDYEEGTWTPAFSFDVGGTGIVYGSRAGKYTKVGNAVHVSFIIVVNSGVGTNDYWARLSDIPFVGNGTNHFSGRVRLNNTGFANFNISVDGGTDTLLCYHSNGTSDYARGDHIIGQQLSGSFTYYTNS